VNPKVPSYPRLAQGKSWNEVSLLVIPQMRQPFQFHGLDKTLCNVYVFLQEIILVFCCQLNFVSTKENIHCGNKLTVVTSLKNATLLSLFLQMTVTWTNGYDITEAIPFVEWGEKGGRRFLAPAGTLTFDRNSMCDKLLFS
jgi:hypothetical protein